MARGMVWGMVWVDSYHGSADTYLPSVGRRAKSHTDTYLPIVFFKAWPQIPPKNSGSRRPEPLLSLAMQLQQLLLVTLSLIVALVVVLEMMPPAAVSFVQQSWPPPAPRSASPPAAAAGAASEERASPAGVGAAVAVGGPGRPL